MRITTSSISSATGSISLQNARMLYSVSTNAGNRYELVMNATVTIMSDIQHIQDRQQRENYRFDIVELGGKFVQAGSH